MTRYKHIHREPMAATHTPLDPTNVLVDVAEVTPEQAAWRRVAFAKIADSTEQLSNNSRLSVEIREQISNTDLQTKLTVPDVISLNVVRTVEKLKAKYILTPTSTGRTAQLVCRLKPRCWVLAFSVHKRVCEFLAFSYGVFPFSVAKKSQSRPEAVLKRVKAARLVDKGDAVVITERRFSWRPGGTDSLHVVVID